MSETPDSAGAMPPPPPAVADPGPPASAWAIVRGGRRFGPFDVEEARRWFVAGMVQRDDRIEIPGETGTVTAQEAATRLQAPVARWERPSVARAATAQGAPGAKRPGLRGTVAALWLVGLFALQLTVVPKGQFATRPTMLEFLATASLHFVLAACVVGVVFVAIAAVRRRRPGRIAPLLALSAFYAGLLGWRVTHPEPAPQPTQAARVAVIEPQAASPVAQIPAPEAAPAADDSPSTVGPEPFQWANEEPADTTPAPVRTTSATKAPAVARAAPGKVLDTWWIEADRLYEAGDWNALLAHAEAWVGEQPARPVAWLYRGLAHSRRNEIAQSIADNEQALRLDGNYTPALRNLGSNLLRINDYTRATVVLALWAEVEPRSVQAHNDLGYALAMKGEYDESVVALERAVALDPGYTLAWKNLVFAHSRAGYPDRAREAFERGNGRR